MAMSDDNRHCYLAGLKPARKKRGWTLQKTAERSGLPTATIVWKYEQPDCKSSPRLKTVVKLSEALGITIDELVYGP
jgi:transcriptional regulator with XRE-family HTH domain